MAAKSTRGFLAIANALGTALSMASAVAGLIKPELALPGASGNALSTFYTQAYVARAVPLGLGVLWLLATRHRALKPALVLAGVVQAGDSAIGLVHHNPGMTAGAAAAAVLHLGSAWWLARADRTAAPVPATA
ncbi:hypothetical protein FNH05_23750 [Amycolatopsis rhizosphaerae]|uniref:DUF4267 domain-containing protein n=1 Tax=Amycolatopsis rhizosphaerae TaxID=2053003 RepID=A0A558BTF2_9PSEU|nr:hypothetical protein [Amycolatopsis rhizosphaerae]TVT39784.1 hypothetical protein FNH05_23750 [Amycolatopsis rhizosphaerae]